LRPILTREAAAVFSPPAMRLAGKALIALAVLALGACSPTGSLSPSTSGAPIAVLGAENFYADLLAQIGGSHVTASSILSDPSADPHEYEASPAAAKLVADSRLVIVNGIGYDDFMDKLLGASTKPDRVVINAQDILGVKDDANVHIWYDPATMPRVAEAAAAALAKIDPQNAAYFAEGKARYLAALKPFNDKIAALKAKYAGAPIAFTENVAGYLTDAIGLKVLTPPEFMEAIESGTDPAPADVAAERDLLTGRKVKALLYNSQVTSPLTEQIRELATKNNVPVVAVAETIPPNFKTFQEWQLAQLDELERALAK
jgi:zinc/manganese transport system substrate-binding protein